MASLRLRLRALRNGVRWWCSCQTVQHFLLCQVRRIAECLPWRLSKAVFAGMGALLVILAHPAIQIKLQLLQRGVQLFAKRNTVELFLYGAVKPFADAVGRGRQLH